MSAHSLDVNYPEFQTEVLDESKTRPVVVDFWAPWCGPCKTLKPLLEKLADEYGGQFRLVKVNADDNQALSQQFGVRGIPAVKAFVDGRLVDEFSGALPEGEVRAFLDRLLPSPADTLRAQAGEARAAGDVGGALKLLAEASKLAPTHVGIRLDAAEIMLDLGETDEATRLLDSVPADVDPRVAQLRARLQFEGQTDGDEAGLLARVAANADDLDARLSLASVYVAGHRYEEGMEQLLEIVRRDRTFQDDVGRRTLLSVFELIGGGELVSRYRRMLASALN